MERKVLAPILPNPVNLATVSEAGKVTLTWNKVAGADSYNIYYGGEAGVNPRKAAKIGGIKGLAYEHKGLKNGTAYFYVVTAANASVESLPSAEVGGMPRGSAPAQPAGITASISDKGVVNVKWEPVPTATSYRICYAEKPGMAALAGTGQTVSTNFFSHTGVKSGGHYFYAVAALNDSGQGPFSQESGVLMKVSPPGQPANLAVAVYPDKITLKWDVIGGAQSYNVYISKTGAFDKGAVEKINVASSSFSHTGLVKGDRYFYRVTAVNSSGEGPASNKVGAKI